MQATTIEFVKRIELRFEAPSKGTDRDRLAYLAAGLNLNNTPAAQWKLRLVTSGQVTIPR